MKTLHLSDWGYRIPCSAQPGPQSTRNFGADVSQSVMGTQMASSYVGIMLAPALCGVLGQHFGMWVFPVYLLVFFVVMIGATVRVKRVLKV